MRRRLLIGLTAVCALGAASARAGGFDFGVDVPATLGGITCVPNALAHHDAAGYAAGAPLGTLPDGTVVRGLARTGDGALLFTLDVPVTLGGTTYAPADVIRYASGSYATYASAAQLGLGGDAAIDAIALDGSGTAVVTFDAPQTSNGTTFGPADLVRLDGGPTLLWAGGANGVPDGTRITALEIVAPDDYLLGFDVPVTLGGVAVVPGDIAEYRTGTWSVYFHDASFPAGASMTDFDLLPVRPGVANGLTVSKPTPGALTLAWARGCSPDATDYAVYEGAIGAWSGYAAAVCSTGGATNQALAMSTGNRFYVVVPVSAQNEGSYGTDSAGHERPPAFDACRSAQDTTATCP